MFLLPTISGNHVVTYVLCLVWSFVMHASVLRLYYIDLLIRCNFVVNYYIPLVLFVGQLPYLFVSGHTIVWWGAMLIKIQAWLFAIKRRNLLFIEKGWCYKFCNHCLFVQCRAFGVGMLHKCSRYYRGNAAWYSIYWHMLPMKYHVVALRLCIEQQIYWSEPSLLIPLNQ